MKPLSIADEITEVVKRTLCVAGITEMDDLSGKSVCDQMISEANRVDSYAPIKDIILHKLQDTDKLLLMLHDLLREIDILEVNRERRERFGERWWSIKSSFLHDVFKEEPQQGFEQWLNVYAESFITWQLEICRKLTDEPFVVPNHIKDTLTLFKKGTQAFLDEQYIDTIDLLEYMINVSKEGQSEYLLSQTYRAVLMVIMGRICLFKLLDKSKALLYFKLAEELAPNDGRILAALGDFYRMESEIQKALGLYQQAIELNYDQPDGFIGMALLAEDQKKWKEAEEWYSRATLTIQDDNIYDLGFGRLILPNGNAYLYLARKYSKEDPERALNLINLAIDSGINHDGEYPERMGFMLQGEILEKLNKNSEAAEAYYQAGRRFYWNSEYPVADQFLANANRLNSEHIPTYWYWADALRMASYIQDISTEESSHFINKSLEIWAKGREKIKPDEDFSWVYVTRALINERLATFVKKKIRIWELYWEAIAYLEEAVILNSSEVYRWAYLARYYRYLELESCSLQAALQALGEDGERNDPLPLEERAAVLANTGNSDEALTIIEKRRSLGKNLWADGVKAYILYLQGRTEEALELINQVMEEDRENCWNINFRAQCLRILNELSKAAKDYNLQWSKYNPSDESNKDFYALAALWLSCIQSEIPDMKRLDQAIDMIQSYEQDPADRSGYAYEHLGLCYLIRGNVQQGEEFINKRIHLAINKRQLYELENLELNTIERLLTNWPHGNLVLEALKRLKVKIKVKREELERPFMPVDEIKVVIAIIEDQQKADTLLWTGAMACLARHYSRAGNLIEAAEIYQRLLKSSEIFPEAFLGLKTMLERIQNEGDNLVKENKISEAYQCYKKILDYKDHIEEIELYPNILCRIALTFFIDQDIENARKFFIDALKNYHKVKNPEPGRALGETCKNLIQNANQYWILSDYLRSLSQSVDLDDRIRLDLQNSMQTLQLFLDEVYRLSNFFSKSYSILPPVTPIVIEISHNLMPKEGPDRDWPLLNDYLPQMRNRIKETTGVEIPGILVRDDEQVMPSNSYVILLDEVPLFSGQIDSNKGFAVGLPEKLVSLGIPNKELVEGINPLTGDIGCWINIEYWTILSKSNIQIITDPDFCMIKQLEQLIRNNLAYFMGIQEAHNLIEQWQQTSEEAMFLVYKCLPDQISRYRFARVLRALVKEQVPILLWKDILEVVQKTGLLHDDITKIVSSVRIMLKKQLPGNQSSVRLIKLPEEFEKTIEQWIGHTHGKTFFSAPPEATQDLLTIIKKIIEPSDTEQALIARHAELRPYIKRLVKVEFPYLMVMSENEVLAKDEYIKDTKVNEHKTETHHE